MNVHELCAAIRELNPDRYEALDILIALSENRSFVDKEVTETLVAAIEAMESGIGNEHVIAYLEQAEQDTTRI